MDAKQAVDIAKYHVKNMFEKENIFHLGLEEVEFDPLNDEWNITIGFSRNWEESEKNILSNIFRPNRIYKIVRIKDSNGDVISLKNHKITEQYETVNS